MSTQSKIEWTESTWNPIAAFLKRDIEVTIGNEKKIIPKGTRGWFCVKCSPGCLHCYAEGINLRLGNGLEYLHRNLADIEFRLVNLYDPIKWKKPRMVFVNSMTDLFLEHIPDEMIDQIFAIMAMAPRHTFQVLTKRAKRMSEYFEQRKAPRLDGRWPLSNVWLGVSVEDQPRGERILHLLQTPAACRFLSVEPMIGPVNLTKIDDACFCNPNIGWDALRGGETLDNDALTRNADRVNWVIVGGESGRGARPCNIDWIRKVVNQCKAANVPVFVKQLGARVIDEEDCRVVLNHPKGGDWNEWPEDLRVREFPKAA